MGGSVKSGEEHAFVYKGGVNGSERGARLRQDENQTRRGPESRLIGESRFKYYLLIIEEGWNAKLSLSRGRDCVTVSLIREREITKITDESR